MSKFAISFFRSSHLEYGLKLTGDPRQLIKVMLKVHTEVLIKLVNWPGSLILWIETLLILYTWINLPIGSDRLHLSLPQILNEFIDLIEQLLHELQSFDIHLVFAGEQLLAIIILSLLLIIHL